MVHMWWVITPVQFLIFNLNVSLLEKLTQNVINPAHGYLHENDPMTCANMETRNIFDILSTEVCIRSARSRRHGPFRASIKACNRLASNNEFPWLLIPYFNTDHYNKYSSDMHTLGCSFQIFNIHFFCP